MADDRPTISSSRVPASEVSQRAFGVVRRGFDPEEVRAYLELVARELQAAERREQELLHELTASENRAQHPVIDEGVLTTALGQRSAAVLRNAHEEAARIALQAEQSAAGVVRDAQQQATDVQVSAESSAAERIAEAELEANALRQQARDEAAAMLDAGRAEAENLIERARDHGRTMLEQAQDARRRVLADMAHRRRIMAEQIEQFRAARDEIGSSIVGVRHAVDRVVDDLARADDAARAAAADAARHVNVDAPEAVLVAEAEQAAAALGADSGGALAMADDVLARPAHPQVAIRFDDIATVVGPSAEREAPGREADAREASAREAAGRALPTGGAASGASGASAPGGILSDPRPTPRSAPRVDPASHEPLLGADPLEDVGASADVDGLFARLRARQDAGAPQGQGAGAGLVDAGRGSGSPSGQEPTGGEPSGSVGASAGRSGAPPAAGSGAAPDVRNGNEERQAANGRTEKRSSARAARSPGPAADEPADEPGAPGEGEEPTPDQLALVRRAAVLDPIVSTMARRLKRALQDDQNGLLDRLRKGPGTWTSDLLPEERTQRALYAKASVGGVRDAMVAGTSFARSELGGRHGRPPGPDQKLVDAITEELTSTVVTLLRRRLEGGEMPDAAERIGAAYREWRGERIERLAEDRATEAFGAGVLSGAARGGVVRWVRGDGGPGCADCEDNALAGPVAPGEEFPTGHRHPPAHAGCRCLVLPAPQ